MQRRGNLLTSSLASGFIFGFLSGVPFVGALNCACCSLILGAGVLTSYLLVKGSDLPISFGRAAAGGFFAGAIAVPVYLITTFAFSIIMGGGDFQRQIDQAVDQMSQYPEAQQAGEMIREMGVGVLVAILGVVCLFFYSVFGTVGGLLGRALFERRQAVVVVGQGSPAIVDQTPPPPRGGGWPGGEGGSPPVNPS